MKTRAEDLENAVKEALQMLARGRPADAQETLSAALDAPTDDFMSDPPSDTRDLRVFFAMHTGTLTAKRRDFLGAQFERALAAARDAALEEAREIMGGAFREVDAVRTEGAGYRSGASDLHAMAQARLAALQSAPAQVVSVAKVREVLADVLAAFRVIGPAGEGGVYALKREARRLGVDLDAAPVSQGPRACVCGHGLHAVNLDGSTPCLVPGCGCKERREEGSR